MYPIYIVTYTCLCVHNCSYAIFRSLQYRSTLTIVSNVFMESSVFMHVHAYNMYSTHGLAGLPWMVYAVYEDTL